MLTKKISSIKKIGTSETLDLEVDHPDHNFYAGDLVSSNSHSIAYANLAAWTLYLKFNHSQEFFLSLLKMSDSEPNPQSEVSKISQELPFFGIRLLPPNLLKSKMDFSIEGKNIRYGLSSIKGISDKSLDALRKFRDEENSTKFDLFLAAKQAGLNIGILSALIQAGALTDDLSADRSKLVLEAQLFNILTDREKRNFIAIAEKDDVDLFSIFKTITSSDFTAIGDDNKPLMKESRYNTLKKKYDPYKKIYHKNSKSQSFANWYFEKELLGFSYSSDLCEVFTHETSQPRNSVYFKGLEPRESAKYIFSVAFSKKERSRNGNLYIKLELEDEYGSLDAIMVDSARENKCSNYLEKHPVPKEGSIVTLYGQKTRDGDAIFVDNMKIVDDEIYMKLKDVKS